MQELGRNESDCLTCALRQATCPIVEECKSFTKRMSCFNAERTILTAMSRLQGWYEFLEDDSWVIGKYYCVEGMIIMFKAGSHSGVAMFCRVVDPIEKTIDQLKADGTIPPYIEVVD